MANSESKITFGSIFNFLMRLVILGLLVFGATTYIPATPVSTNNKLVISAVVVLIYSIIDFIKYVLIQTKGLVCRVACGCGKPKEKQLTADLDLSDV